MTPKVQELLAFTFTICDRYVYFGILKRFKFFKMVRAKKFIEIDFLMFHFAVRV